MSLWILIHLPILVPWCLWLAICMAIAQNWLEKRGTRCHGRGLPTCEPCEKFAYVMVALSVLLFFVTQWHVPLLLCVVLPLVIVCVSVMMNSGQKRSDMAISE
jgi:hypothetical protein